MFRRFIGAGLVALLCAAAADAQVSGGAAARYDTASRELVMPSVMVGNTVYKDVTVRLDEMAVTRASGGSPLAFSNLLSTYMGAYDEAKQELVLPAVILNGDTVYTHVGVRIGRMAVLGVGSATGVPFTVTCSWDNFSQAKFSAIAPGMTYAQVVALVGCLPDPDGPSPDTDSDRRYSGTAYLYNWYKPGSMTDYLFGVYFDQPEGVVKGPEWLSSVPGSPHQHKWSMQYTY